MHFRSVYVIAQLPYSLGRRCTVMPRYFSNLREGDRLLENPEGCVLPNLSAAHGEALAEARDLFAAYVRAGTLLDGQHSDITDQHGQILKEVLLTDALNLPR